MTDYSLLVRCDVWWVDWAKYGGQKTCWRHQKAGFWVRVKHDSVKPELKLLHLKVFAHLLDKIHQHSCGCCFYKFKDIWRFLSESFCCFSRGPCFCRGVWLQVHRDLCSNAAQRLGGFLRHCETAAPATRLQRRQQTSQARSLRQAQREPSSQGQAFPRQGGGEEQSQHGVLAQIQVLPQSVSAVDQTWMQMGKHLSKWDRLKAAEKQPWTELEGHFLPPTSSELAFTFHPPFRWRSRWRSASSCWQSEWTTVHSNVISHGTWVWHLEETKKMKWFLLFYFLVLSASCFFVIYKCVNN